MWAAQTGVSTGLPRNAMDFLSGAFGPLSPILPMPINEPGPDGRAAPRRWQFPVGWNLPVGQPGSEGLKLASFATLRSAADAYSVVRAMLNIRIQEMAGMNWDIGATPDAQSKTKGDKGAVQDQRDRSAQIVKWFKRVDPNYYGFQSWFTALLEEQFVTDAISIYLHPTRVKGKGLFKTDLAALEAIDGTTIRPLLDINGATPKAPNVAYNQYLWGVPRVDLMSLIIQDDLDEIERQMEEAGMDEDPLETYRADQLMYLPRFRRVFTPYGFGAIEQALMPISIGMNRQQYLLNFFTEGTIPGVYVIAGDQYVTPAQQRQLQDTLNALAGDQAWKHRVIVLPPNSKTEAQKDMGWTQGVDQTIIEQVAMILHIQMQEISMLPGGKSAGLGGKGATESQMESVAATRTRPDRRWWKETVFDWLVQQYWGQEDLEFKWVDFDAEEDRAQKAQAEVALIQAGKLSIDETRIEDGLDPWNTPFTSKPYIVVNNQLVSLDPTIAPYPAAQQPPAGGGIGGDAPPPTPPHIGPDGKPVIGPDGKPVPAKLGPDGKPLPPSMEEAHPGAPKQPLPGLKKPEPQIGPDGKPVPVMPPHIGPDGKPLPDAVGPVAPQHGPGEDPAKPNEAPATKPGERAIREPDALPPHQRSPIDIMAEAKEKDPDEKNAPPKELVHEGADRSLPHPSKIGPDGKPLADAAQDGKKTDDGKDEAAATDAKPAPKEPLTDEHFDDNGKPVVGGTAKPGAKEKPAAKKMTVAEIVKRRVEYKDSKLPDIVHDYLLRSYPPDDVKWSSDPDIEWEFDPHVNLSDINMARRPGGRDPEKVQSIGDSLDAGASMDPVVLVDLDNPAGLVIADGWHRILGAEHASWGAVPAFVGRKCPQKYADIIGGRMQDDSDSKKAAVAELAVLRRFVRKGGVVANFRTTAIDSDTLTLLADDIEKGDRDAAFEHARTRIAAQKGNPQGLIDWYNGGADGQIDWGSPGDFYQCVDVAGNYMSDDDAKGFCNLRHSDATGMSTAEHSHEDKADKDFSLSAPLSTGLVPYDLPGSRPSPGNACPTCGKAFVLDGGCPEHGKPESVVKYSEDQPRGDNGRWTNAGAGGEPDPERVSAAQRELARLRSTVVGGGETERGKERAAIEDAYARGGTRALGGPGGFHVEGRGFVPLAQARRETGIDLHATREPGQPFLYGDYAQMVHLQGALGGKRPGDKVAKPESVTKRAVPDLLKAVEAELARRGIDPDAYRS